MKKKAYHLSPLPVPPRSNIDWYEEDILFVFPMIVYFASTTVGLPEL